MVSFSCESCNDTLKKPKLDSHAQRCKWARFTCLDCNVTFQGTDYRAHTACITEDEKYQKTVYKGKKGATQGQQKAPVLAPQLPPHLTAFPPTPAPTPVAVVAAPVAVEETVNNGIHPDRQRILDLANGKGNGGAKVNGNALQNAVAKTAAKAKKAAEEGKGKGKREREEVLEKVSHGVEKVMEKVEQQLAATEAVAEEPKKKKSKKDKTVAAVAVETKKELEPINTYLSSITEDIFGSSKNLLEVREKVLSRAKEAGYSIAGVEDALFKAMGLNVRGKKLKIVLAF